VTACDMEKSLGFETTVEITISLPRALFRFTCKHIKVNTCYISHLYFEPPMIRYDTVDLRALKS